MTCPALAQDDSTIQSPAQADTTTAACLNHNPSGIGDSDAHTAALFVCQALRGHCTNSSWELESCCGGGP